VATLLGGSHAVTGGVFGVSCGCVLNRPPSVTIYLYGCHTLKSLHIAQSAVVTTRRDTGSLDQFGTTERFVGPKQCGVQLCCSRCEIGPEARCWKRGGRVFNCGRRRRRSGAPAALAEGSPQRRTDTLDVASDDGPNDRRQSRTSRCRSRSVHCTSWVSATSSITRRMAGTSFRR